ncbi:MAG: hypothetical protein BWX67_02322 [Thermotogae bacterium ADurb.Bin062]|nr:MAG: hypothetical protein BWX67_02322 [Thermotogota bacterium ADurb.Bin062]
MPGLRPRTTNPETPNLKLKDQARKSIWWMPWHQEPKKDVISCDKLW